MSKKLLAIVVGILLLGVLSGTALAGNEGPIDLTAFAVKSKLVK